MPSAKDLPLSRRAGSIKPSATLAVGMKANELRSRGVDVLSFAAGEPDFPAPKAVCEAAKAAIDAGEHHYAPVPGDAATRRIIAQKLERENGLRGVTADHIVISSGGKQSLFLAFHALLDPPASAGGIPNKVLLPVPAWVSYRPQIELAGGEVVELPTTADTDFKLTPAQLDDAITPDTRLVVLNSPSNPCGTMYSEPELRALAGVIADAAADRAPHLVVVTDEIYEKLVFGGMHHFSLASVPEIAERTATINGLSKSYAMTGWRVGYLAGCGAFGERLANACKRLQSQLNTSIPAFILPAARAALTECADEVETMRRAFAERAAIMHDALSAIDGVVCPRPTGAFYCFCDVSAVFGGRSVGNADVRDARSFAEALLDEHHVAVVPGDDFGGTGPRCVRLTFATDPATIRDGVGRFADFIRGLR